MIRLNRMTDYAVTMLAQMGQHDGYVQTAAALALESGVPQPTVAKLLRQLAQAGVLVSQRGATGGYRLARDASAISVAEIITALEGPISLTACVDGAEGGCEVERLCPVRGNWDRVNSAIREALEGVSLADMAAAPFDFPAPAPRRVDAAV